MNAKSRDTGLGTAKLPVIGLTGPMCSGKNAAGAILKRLGFAVVDADETAHEALRDMQAEVVEAFSGLAREREVALIAADGSLDRRALGRILFANPELLARHESIIYPRINLLLNTFIDAEIEKAAKREAADGGAQPLRGVVINAPLLHKSPILDRCDFVIFIDSWLPIRIIRARMRDKLPFRQIFARFSAQKHLFAQYLLKDVDIQRVQNRGSIRALEKRLVILLSRRGY
jgi:dephospho-CoA kinase